MDLVLYQLAEVTPPCPVLEPGKYMVAHGNRCALTIRLFHPTTPAELADMIEAMRRAEAA